MLRPIRGIMTMIDLNELYLFAQVVDQKSFASAARLLGVPKSTLSRKISQLEERLGVRLLQRSTRQLSVTDIGQVYYQHCAGIIAEAEAAQDAIDSAQAEPRGRLRVTCPVSLMQSYMSRIVADYLITFPRVTVDLEATNRRVDIVEEGVDIALRVRFPPLEDTGLVMKRLAMSHQVIVASPALLERLGTPDSPGRLADYPSMALASIRSRLTWDLAQDRKDKVSIVFSPRYVTDDMAALALAAQNSVGIVQLPFYMVQDQLRAGSLISLMPDWPPAAGIIHAVFSSRRGQSPAMRSFVDFIAKAFSSLDAPA
jgi:DNA-binding transcriptional LysR family regulator